MKNAKDRLWKEFLESGSVSAYLLYKEMEEREKNSLRR